MAHFIALQSNPENFEQHLVINIDAIKFIQYYKSVSGGASSLTINYLDGTNYSFNKENADAAYFASRQAQNFQISKVDNRLF